MTFFAKSVIGNLAFSPDVYFQIKSLIGNFNFFLHVYSSLGKVCFTAVRPMRRAASLIYLRPPHLFYFPTRFLEHLWINNKREKVISHKHRIGLCINSPCLRLVIYGYTKKNSLRNVCKALYDYSFSLN